MNYRAETDVVLAQALDRMVELARVGEGRGGFVAWSVAVSAAQRRVCDVVQQRVEEAAGTRRKWWPLWK